MNCVKKRNSSLIDLLWDDILFAKIFPFITIKELFILRGLSSKYKLLIDTYFQQIKYVNLGPYCKAFSVDAFQVLLKNCTQLRELLLPNCKWLTDDLIVPLFENNTNLSKIVLDKCSGLTSVCLQPVIINCKDLKCLSLASCGWLTLGCLQSITLHQHELEEVDISLCTMVDSLETINNFLILSHKLKVLNLSCLVSVNDLTLTILARSAKNLELLNVCTCLTVTDYGISMVIEYCHNLRSVLCIGCPKVSTLSLKTRCRQNLVLIPPLPTDNCGLTILIRRGINV